MTEISVTCVVFIKSSCFFFISYLSFTMCLKCLYKNILSFLHNLCKICFNNNILSFLHNLFKILFFNSNIVSFLHNLRKIIFYSSILSFLHNLCKLLSFIAVFSYRHPFISYPLRPTLCSYRNM